MISLFFTGNRGVFRTQSNIYDGVILHFTFILVKMLHHRLLTEFQIQLRHIAQNQFRTQWNTYDGAFLQKQRLKVVNYFYKIAPPQAFDWVSKYVSRIYCQKYQKFKRHLPHHNCVIPNIKVYFDKNSNIFSFGASIIVEQSFSLLNICTFKMKSNVKHLYVRSK